MRPLLLLPVFLAVMIAMASAVAAAELADLRNRALALVNQARQGQGLAQLELTGPLNQAAQKHAEDMLRRGYYSHSSPEGDTVKDRFRDEGGSRWKLVAENLARCVGCPVPATRDRVEAFQRGWMDSPGHRKNILANGLAGFGFGLAAADGKIFAVQTFAGPGEPRGLAPDEAPVALDRAGQSEAALRAVNRERERAGLGALQPSQALNTVARGLLPDNGDSDSLIDRPDDLYSLLPEGAAADWHSLAVLAAACGGCGTEPTAADIRYFAGQWSGDPEDGRTVLAAEPSHLGFAMQANGEGRKIAIAVMGRRR